MEEYISALYRGFCLLMAGYGIYFAALSLCALWRKRPLPEADRRLRFAVLVAARNEEGCIAGIVESVKGQDYPQELVDIYVIPNNCTDDTAAVAAAAGAQIIEVSSAVRSKGQALHEAFAHLLETDSHEAYCVFDADNEADAAFLGAMNRALAAGSRVAKSRILAKNPHESWVCACYEAFFCNANLFLNSSRHKVGLSARLIGTGFALRRELLEELGGWNTATLTEDAEFYAMLSARGERIAFVPEAITYDEQPLSLWESLIQRRRWMSGIIEVGRRKGRELLRGIFGGGGKLAFDALVQISYPGVQGWLIPLFLLWALAQPTAALSTLPASAAVFYITTLFTGGTALLLEGRLTRHTGRALFLYPVFILSFVPLQTLSLFCPNRRWRPIPHTGRRVCPQWGSGVLPRRFTK